jgi:radical SAM superfamily enzyme YgiQ (UPF0313 family)
MYTTKNFSIKKPETLKIEIGQLKSTGIKTNKIFLADGDALVLSTSKLLNILNDLKSAFPGLRRISTYAKPKDIAAKSDQELIELRDAGLNMVYTGLESGDDKVLELMSKGETYQSSVNAMIKCKKAGIKSSVMIINGLGGVKYSKPHAINSAKLVNEIQPEYLSTLVLSFPFGIKHFQERIKTNFELPDTIGLLNELGLFIANTALESSIFRSDHASNYLVLKGILGKDKEFLLQKISAAVQNPENAFLREEWQRGL